jgi:hypothetical protein
MAVVSDYWKNRYKSKPFFFYNTHFDFLKKQISFQRSHSRRTCHGLSFPFVVRRGENVLRSLWTILVTLTTNERDASRDQGFRCELSFRFGKSFVRSASLPSL